MKKILLLEVLLLALLFCSPVYAANITLSWTNATQNTDATLIPTDATQPNALASTTVFWGACLVDDTPALPWSEVTVPTTIPGNPETAQVIITTPGRWCFVATHLNNSGQVSDLSNVALKTVSATVPLPPPNLTVTNMTVYYVIQQPGSFILLPVGTIPASTVCNPTQYVNGFFAVPVDQVTWTGSVRPLVVVAQCG